MFFKRTDNLTSNLTSYDFLKFVALIFMLCDHVGAFFIPDEPWLRAIGRLSFPIFFFLAGYASDSKIKTDIIWGAMILIVGGAILGSYSFPLNALVSYILVKMFIRVSAEKTFSGWEPLLYMVAALMFLIWPTNQLFEYGSFAILLGMMGYAVRHSDKIHIKRWMKILLFTVSILSMSIGQIIFHRFDMVKGIFCIGGFSIMGYILYHFRYIEYPKLTNMLTAPVSKIIQFGGRYTLELYVFHLLAIKAYLLYANYGHYNWFSPTYFPNFPLPN